MRIKNEGNKTSSRYYLIVPGLSRRKDEGDESFFNHLLIVTGSTPSFLQVLWHGCTSSDLIEVKPWSIDTMKSQTLTIRSFEKRTLIDVGSIDMEIRCLEALPQLQHHHLASALLQPVSFTRYQYPFASVVLMTARERLQSLFAFNEDQQSVVDSVLLSLMRHNLQRLCSLFKVSLEVEKVFSSLPFLFLFIHCSRHDELYWKVMKHLIYLVFQRTLWL